MGFKYLWCFLLMGCVTTEQRQESAERNAHTWCVDLGLGNCTATCSGVDGNGDGYVSCTVKLDDDTRIPLECGFDYAVTLMGQNTGCREQRAYTVSGSPPDR